MKTHHICGVLLIVMLTWPAHSVLANTPPGFHWVNMEADKAVMAKVRASLHDKTTTAIREVGVEDQFALVMTASRETDAPTPDYDQWSVYSLSLATEQSRLLFTGYGVQLLDWIGKDGNELAITYYDCWECEAATLYTTVHFKPRIGWVPRWTSKTGTSPGAVVFDSDMGDPYTDDEVQQVFAVVFDPDDSFSVGNWVYSTNSKTGKIVDSVTRYSIDPTSGKDVIEELTGAKAQQFKRDICKPSLSMTIPNRGQDSQICKAVLKLPKPASKVTK